MPRYTPYQPWADAGDGAAAYCDRCKRGFKTENGFNLHIQMSRRHWDCPKCGFDADGWDALLYHCRVTNCRSVCQGCDNGVGEHWAFDSYEFKRHFDKCNVCTDCEEHFNSPQDLDEHDCPDRESEEEEDEGYGEEETCDNERDGERYGEEEETYHPECNNENDNASDDNDRGCPKCGRSFKTCSSTILHLESGVCSYVDRTTLDHFAAMCSSWPYYMYQNSRIDILNGWKPNDEKWYTYHCPTCKMSIKKLSSLLQHVEARTCEQTLTDGAIGTMLHYMAERLYR